MYHALGLIIIGGIGLNMSQSTIRIPAYLILSGVIIFSGSLYLLALTNARWLGVITPLGGICFIIGWLLLALNIYRS